MTFEVLEKKIEKAGYTLKKENVYDFWKGECKYIVAKSYVQYTGGNNTQVNFKTMDEVVIWLKDRENRE